MLNNKSNRGLEKQTNTQIARGIDKFLTQTKKGTNKQKTHEPRKVPINRKKWTRKGANKVLVNEPANISKMFGLKVLVNVKSISLFIL